jgi:hypothetical protein
MNAIGAVGNWGGFLNNSSGPVNNSWENICRLQKIIQPFVGAEKSGDGHVNQGSELIIKPSAQGTVPETSGHIDLCA